VGGDGSRDDKTRKWTVYLSRGETDTMQIRLENSRATRNVVNVLLMGPPETIGLCGEDRYPVPAGSSIIITISAVAYDIAARGPHRYVVDLGYSFNMGDWR
jgi:hypothetical protein